MFNYDEIVKKAQESYNRFFKDLNYLPKESEIDDITINVQNLEDNIKEKASQAEAHLAYLNELKEKLSEEAKEANERTFPNDYKEASSSLTKMHDEYVDAQKRLFDLQVKVANLKHHD